MAHFPEAPLWVSVELSTPPPPTRESPPPPRPSTAPPSVASSGNVPRSGAYARLPSAKDVRQPVSASGRRLPRAPTLTRLKPSGPPAVRQYEGSPCTSSDAHTDSQENISVARSKSAQIGYERKQESAFNEVFSVSSIDISQLEVDFKDIQYRLGIGTYGSVHFGKYFGEPVAVKRVEMPPVSGQLYKSHTVMKARAQALATFGKQVRKYERVQHPSIVRFLGVAVLQEEQAALIITELMYGGSLADSLKQLKRNRKHLSPSAAVRVALQVCGALRALHFNSVVWGDAKPENILLTESLDEESGEMSHTSRACISDLGVASSVVQCLLSDTTVSSATMASTTSYAYLSPEGFAPVGRNELAIAKASDVYALGSVLYEMLTLRTPWAKCSMGAVYRALVTEKRRPSWPQPGDSDFISDIPMEIRALVQECWAQRPEDRPTAENMFKRLVNCRDTLQERASLALPPRASADKVTSTDLHHASLAMHKDSLNSRDLDKKSSSRSKSSEASTVVPVEDPIDLGSPPNMADGQFDTARACFGERNSASPTSSFSRGDQSGEDCAIPRVSPVTSPEPRSNGLVTARIEEEIRRATTNHSAPVIPSAIAPSDFTSSAPAELGLPPGKTTGPAPFISPVTAPVLEPVSSQRNLGIEDRQQNLHQSDSNQEEGDVRSLYKRKSNPPDIDTGAFGSLTLDLPQQPGAPENLRSAFQESVSRPDVARHTNLDASVAGHELPNFAEAIGKAAYKIEKKRSSRPDADDPSQQTLFGTLGADNAAIFGSVDLSASSATVQASLRRKRSSQIHAILERAGMAFLELHRRGELKNSMSPSMRRRAAERRVVEEAKSAAQDAKAASVDHYVEQIHLLRKEDQYSEIIQLMEAHADVQPVAKAGVSALEEAASMEAHYVDICEEGAIDRLLAAVTQFGKEDTAMCKAFCRAISALSGWYTPKVEHHIRAAGIPSEVVSIMEYHTSVADLQAAGCDCLARIASSSELSRSAVATLGGPLAVYRAMTRNIATFKNVDLARASLKAVKSIADKNQRAAETFVEVAGLDSVSHAADVFADDGLEENILEALESFAFFDGGRRTIITSNGLKALSTLMLRNREAAFAERCCVLIRSVALWRDTKCEEAMLESAIAERTVMTIRLSNRILSERGNRLAFYSSQAVMYLASFGKQSRTRLRMTGAIDAVINLMQNRGDNPRVVTMATNALVELMKGDTEAQAEAERLGAIEVLLAAAKSFANESTVFEPVSLTLTCFAELKGDNLSPADPLYKFSRQTGRTAVQKLKAGGNEGGGRHRRGLFSGRRR